ncbi:MAG: peptidyl-alpha-hydroxyglycine alpha-amidating lyase family protein [Acidobacteriota bacterium]
MNTISRTLLASALFCAAAFAQKPSNPALLVPQEAPLLDYVPVANPLTFPAGVTIGLSASVTFDPKGHLWVMNRGPQPIAEFDENGKFIRAFGEGLFGVRPHALRLDSDGNIWVADGSTHIVVKLDQTGKVLLTLGTKGKAGAWDENTQLLNQPNEVAFGRNGDVFLVQGHTPGPMGDPRVLKFDKNGKFIKSWGGKGTEPGKFEVAHSININAAGELWVTDRENQRIQIFDQDGKYLRELHYKGLPCSIDIGKENIWMVNGFAGQVLKLDLNGKVLGVMGKPGTELGEFGEAHHIAVSPKGEIFVADVTKGVQKFVKK